MEFYEKKTKNIIFIIILLIKIKKIDFLTVNKQYIIKEIEKETRKILII